jgi:hypothetical protein
MPNAQNLRIQIPRNPLAGAVITREEVLRPTPTFGYRQPPRSVLKLLQNSRANQPRTH